MDLRTLRAAVEAGERFEYLLFYGHASRGAAIGPECLSQWYPGDFAVDGERYATAEQFMMAEKAGLFGDGEIREQILATASPAQAKALGRQVRGFVQEEWEARREEIVFEANRAKFGQNADLAAFLRATAPRILVEAAPRDRIWGIGLSAASPDAADPRRWRGQNLLGFALGRVRDALAASRRHGASEKGYHGRSLEAPVRFFALVPLLGLVACETDLTKDTGTTNAGTDGGGTTSPPEPCVATIASVSPADGAVVPVDTTITATFDAAIGADDDYTLVVSNVDGDVTLAADGRSMTWTGELAVDTEYTVTASVCLDEVQTEFATAPAPIDLTAVDGATFVLPWASVTVTQPELGGVFDLGIDYLLAQIVSVDSVAETAGAVGAMGAAAGGTGDTLASPDPVCSTVADDQVADFSANPLFVISGTIDFVVSPQSGETATLEDFHLEGVMVDGGQRMRDPHLTALLAPESLTLLGGMDCYSKAVQVIGGTCLPCASSPNGYCMLIEASAPEAYVDPGVDILGTCAP